MWMDAGACAQTWSLGHLWVSDVQAGGRHTRPQTHTSHSHTLSGGLRLLVGDPPASLGPSLPGPEPREGTGLAKRLTSSVIC